MQVLVVLISGVDLNQSHVREVIELFPVQHVRPAAQTLLQTQVYVRWIAVDSTVHVHAFASSTSLTLTLTSLSALIDGLLLLLCVKHGARVGVIASVSTLEALDVHAAGDARHHAVFTHRPSTCSRRWREREEQMRGHEMQGRRIGLVGLGRMGRRMRRYCTAFV